VVTAPRRELLEVPRDSRTRSICQQAAYPMGAGRFAWPSQPAQGTGHLRRWPPRPLQRILRGGISRCQDYSGLPFSS